MYHLESQQDPSSLKKVCFHRLLLGETDLLSGNRTLCDFLNSIIKLNNDEYSFFNPLVTTLLTQVTKNVFYSPKFVRFLRALVSNMMENKLFNNL